VNKKPRVLVVGLGPAGASSAIFLSQRGLDVVAIGHKNSQALKIGESLPPDAALLLQQLGVWHEFEQAHHEKCYANKSFWYSDVIQYHDFIQHPIGHGWHIDRTQFEIMLQTKAAALVSQIYFNTRIHALEFKDKQWCVEMTQAGHATTEQSFDFIVDATGRNSWVARRLGVERLKLDDQLALVAFLQTQKNCEDSSSLVETVSNGWWYSAKIPQQRLATLFACHPNSKQKTDWVTEHGWRSLLAESKHTHTRLLADEFELLETPKFVAADSAILKQVYGNSWLAVGDAAMTYDPIAAHGLTMSMVSARDAADAIFAHFEGNAIALSDYSEKMIGAFEAYVQLRQGLFET